MANDLHNLPGGDLVAAGLRDLENGVCTENSLLVSIAAPRLRGLGIAVPEMQATADSFEHRLYASLEDRLGRAGYPAYNALIARIVSFANAYVRP